MGRSDRGPSLVSVCSKYWLSSTLLSQVSRPEPANEWLFTPNPLLDREKPADLLR